MPKRAHSDRTPRLKIAPADPVVQWLLPTTSGGLERSRRLVWWIDTSRRLSEGHGVATVELRILGPLEVRFNGHALDLGYPKQRVTLGVLTLRAGRFVSFDELVFELWGEHPIASALDNARSYVAGIRRLFQSVRYDGVRVIRERNGCRLNVDAGVLDLAAYQAEAAAARTALQRADLTQAEALFERAYARWRGPMLEGLPRGPVLAGWCARAEEDLAGLIDDLAETWLRHGKVAEAIDLLQQQLFTDALREPTYAILMRARYQADGPAAALKVFDTARQVLVEHLGIEPGQKLRELQLQVLKRDPALVAAREQIALAPPTPPPAAPPAAPPRQLPAAATHFVGRDTEAAQLQQILVPSDQAIRHRPAVAVIYGPGGVGKSALAIRTAHQIAEHYPDGQLYVDLLGSTLGVQPPPTVEIVRRGLRALGVQPDHIPASMEEAAALFRSETAGKRLLLLADNAAAAWQVTPLLPASGTCAAVVTSRRPLTPLNADHRLRLCGLPDRHAGQLLDQLSGPRTVDQPHRTAILTRCAGLPLAIRIVAARLAARPELPVQQLAQRLEQHRLNELEHDGLAIRANIRAGYEALDIADAVTDNYAARTLRLFSHLSTTYLTPGLAAAMLGINLDHARGSLEQLVDAQLLNPATGDRYQIHDLVGEAVKEIAAEQDPPTERAHRLQRALVYYAGSSQRAYQAARPSGAWTYFCPEVPGIWLPEVHTAQHAITLFDAQLPNMLSTLQCTASQFPDVRLQWLALSERIWSWLSRRSELSTALEVSQVVLTTARQFGDNQAAGFGFRLLGLVKVDLGEHDAAIDHLQRSADLANQQGDRRAEALALNALGMAAEQRHESSLAVACFGRALSLLGGDASDQARLMVLANRILSYVELNELDTAAADADEAVTLCRRIGHADRLGQVLTNLSAVALAQGRHAQAIAYATEAAELCELTQHPLWECRAFLIRSVALAQAGRCQEALVDADKAFAKVENGYSSLKATVLRHKTAVMRAIGRHELASSIEQSAQAINPTAGTRQSFTVDRLITRHLPAAQTVRSTPMPSTTRLE
jgi:DNA-binding SARP family transcriptional activator/tetratricopeptide (TPR) repeat protein